MLSRGVSASVEQPVAPVVTQAAAHAAVSRAPETRATWLTLRGVDDGRIVCQRVRRASSFAARLLGLMGRPRLAPGEALYLPGTNSIHMLFMRFPIDALFLGRPATDGTQRVIAVRRDLRPWTGVVWYVRGAAGVVELPAGTLAGDGVQPGDVVRLETP